MQSLNLKSYAKVNLTLDVISKRDDGYHDVKMIMQSLDLCDIIELNKVGSGINITTNLTYLPTDSRNIAYIAAQRFYKQTQITDGISIEIHKNIPVAAGLAGGSGNAAAVLYGLNVLYEYPLDSKTLLNMGREIGADVPYCMKNGTMLAEGIGDVLTPISSMPECNFLLVKPSFSVSTAEVYARISGQSIKERPDTKGCIECLDRGDLKGVAIRLYNVLEPVTVAKHAQITQIKDLIVSYGALGACMSGSGSTVFGIFDNTERANKAYNCLKTSFNDVHLCKPSKPNWGVD